MKKAEEAKDEAKVILLQGKITAIENEAEQKAITLDKAQRPTAEAKAQQKQAAKASNVSSISEGKGIPKSQILTGAAKIAAERKAERMAKLAEKDPEAAAAMANLDSQKAKKTGMAKEAKKQRSSHNCLCGCGGETLSLFAPGHDARVKGIILKVERGQMKTDEVPETVQPFVRYKGKWGTDGYVLTAAPVKISGRPEVISTALDALEAMDV